MRFNLKTAVQDAKAMQDFDSESLLMGAEHSQKVKAALIKSDYGSKDYVDLASSTAVFRFNLSNLFEKKGAERGILCWRTCNQSLK